MGLFDNELCMLVVIIGKGGIIWIVYWFFNVCLLKWIGINNYYNRNVFFCNVKNYKFVCIN